MNLEQFQEQLEKSLKEIDIKIENNQVKKFYLYMKQLLEWNKKMNLTAITDPEEILVKHFIDSLTIQKYISKDANVIDIGTGAGFPGIPLKIMREDLEVVLLDSLNKRICFLEEVINSLDLQKSRGVHGRAEELARTNEYREKYEVATSRAVAPLNSLLEYMAPFVKTEGKIICMKGPKIEEELQESENAIKVLGLEIEVIEKNKLPNSDIERRILVLKKVKNMSEKYPRKALNIKKIPL